MRVLLTSTDNPYITQLGGKHIHLLLLEQGLKELGFKVTTLYYNQKSIRELAKRTTLILFSEKHRYKFKLNWMINYLVRRIPKDDFDIVHAHDVLSMLAVAKMPQKKVLTLHGYFARENVEFIKNEKGRKTVYPQLLRLETEGMKNADYVITVDQRLKEYVISQFSYSANKISVMHNAVDTKDFRPITEQEKLKLKEKIGFSKDQFIVLVPRRLVEKNGVIYAVRAMKHLKNREAKMIIAGDGPERGKIIEEAGGDTRIRFVGTIPHNEISPYYKMADIILIPSITSHGVQEASSLAMLEGMACGKAVVCSDIGGMHEIIQHMKNGILVKEKEPLQIAKAVETVIENQGLARDLGKYARDYVLQNHSYVAHAKMVAEIYENVLGAVRSE